MSDISKNDIQGQPWHSMGLPRNFQIIVWTSLSIVFIVSLMDITGWMFSITVLKSIRPEWMTMKLIATFCFILSGLAIILIQSIPSSGLKIWLAKSISFIIGGISLITIIYYLFLITPLNENSLTGIPLLNLFLLQGNRLSFLTSFIFLVTGLILFCLSLKNSIADNIAHILIFPAGFASYFIPVSYILGVYTVPELHKFQVSLYTGIAFCFLCAALIFIRPQTWLMKVFNSRNIGGSIARKILPFILGLPVLIAWLRILGEHSGIFKSEVGVALVALVYTFSFTLLIWFTSRSVNRTDEKRRKSEESLRISENNLRAILDATKESIYMFDKQGNFLVSNTTGAERLNMSLSEFIGQPFTKFMTETLAQSRLDNLKTVFDSGKPLLFEDIRKDMIFSHSFYPVFEDNKVTRVVTYSQDITKRKKVEEALRISEEKFRIIATNTPDHILIQDTDLRYITVINPQMNLTEAEMIGKTDYDLLSQKEASTLCEIKRRVIDSGNPESLTVPLISKDGNIEYFEGSFIPKRNSEGLTDGVIGYFRNITARVKMEETLRETENRFRTIAESVPVLISITRISDDVILFTNESYDEAFGIDKGQLTGKKAPAFFLNSDDRKNLMKIINDKGYIQNYEVLVKKGYGSPFWIITNFQTITFGGEQALLEASMDISLRKKAEEELSQLNRTLNSLGKSSQAMMHALNETQYLTEVCNIIIEDCGHSMVWIGYAQDDDEKSVMPVAYSGFDEGYIKQLDISWADTERGRGPTGTAIRTGKPALCNNMLTDPAFEPWRTEAIKRGYASSIVLPLISEGKTLGAISIYSKETDSFSDAEIDLLSKLGDDLAYGITFIRLIESEKKALKVIKESEEKFKQLSNAIPQLAWIAQPDGYIIWYNQRWYEYTGTTPEQMEGWGWQIVHDKKTLPAVLKNWQASIATGMQFDMVFPLLGKDGIFRDFLTRIIPFKDNEGKVLQWFGTNTDISELRNIEKELQESKNYLESLINYANAPIIVWNTKNKIQLFNHASELLTGYLSGELEGKNLEILFPKTTLKDSNSKIRKALTENLVTIEIPIQTKNKEIRTVLWNSAKIYDGNKKLISTIAQGNDITEKMKAELAVKEAKDKLDLAMENGSIGVWEWDMLTNRIDWDTRMERIFGIKPGTFGKNYDSFEKFIVDEDIPHTREAIKKALELDVPFETVYRIHIEDGNVKHINAKALINRDAEGRPLKMIGVCYDITEMKKGAEKTLFTLNEELLRSNKELEQFAYIASHDLQEPLRMVSSFTQLLAKRYKDKLDSDAQEFIQFAVDGAVRMQELINDLLEFSRIETRGKKFSSIDITKVLELSIKNLGIIIKEKKALVTHSDLPEVFADEGQMIQLFQNLIGNALKFCSGVPRIHVSVKEGTDQYIFSVKDNGIGIEPQYFTRIFQIFQRLQPKDDYGGTGIGLAICKRIVERHGGKIWVESIPENGSEFYFTILKRLKNL